MEEKIDFFAGLSVLKGCSLRRSFRGIVTRVDREKRRENG